ncbi:cytochrome P450 [Obelidium mucronatum]|nr:cytochrome P450 [Obelidium mucronatum]
MILKTLQTQLQHAADALGTTPRNLGLAFGLALTAAFAIRLASHSPKKGKKFPTPKELPILGSMLDFAHYNNMGKQHELFARVHQEHGPIVKMTVLGFALILTNDRDLIHRAYTDTVNFHRDDYLEKSVIGLLDNSLFVMHSGEKWKRHRKYIQPAFGPPQLRYGIQVSQRETNKLIDLWETEIGQAKEGFIVSDLFHEFSCLALDLIGHIAFSQDFHAVEEHHQGKTSETHDMMQDLGRLFQQRTSNLPFTWSFVGIGTSSPRVVQVRKFMDTLVANILKTKREGETSGELTTPHVDLLDRLLAVDASSDQQKFSDEEIVGEVLGFVFAGHETTANSLTFAGMELAQHPEIQQRLKTEIKTVLQKCQGQISVETLAEFKFLDQVIKETQRRHSVVGALTRTTLTEVEYNGYIIPPKTPVVLNLQELHLDPTLWVDPLIWNPDRWSKPTAVNGFIPFSEGPHNCIGQKLALIEMKVDIYSNSVFPSIIIILLFLMNKVTLLLILNKFKFELVQDQELDFVTATTYGLKKGLKVKVSKD